MRLFTGVATDNVNREILLVEHDDRLRASLRGWLRHFFPGIEILEAKDDRAALRLFAGRTPRVILVDIDVTGSVSVESVQRIKAAFPSAEVIALGADDHPALREEASAAGASACVSTWTIHEELLPILEETLTNKETPSSKRTVVCIEDEPEMIRLIELSLERGPFNVIGAVSGQQGLDIARKMKPDLVLLDLMMPGMDGWEVARRLRADESLSDVPIIALSVVHPSAYPARDLDVDDYVTKPFRPGDLRRRAQEAAKIVA
jgi:CheY-like chemotaxis protein